MASLRTSSASGARRHGPVVLLALAGVAVWSACRQAGQAFGAAFPRSGGGPASRTSLRAGEEGAVATITGKCRYDTNNWTKLETIDIMSAEDETLSKDAWELFKVRYPKPAETGIYLDTPVGMDDVRYRFLRLAKTLKVSVKEAFEVLDTDEVVSVVDADFIKDTFEAMVKGSSYETALEVVRKNPAILLSGVGIESKMNEAMLGANVRQFFRPMDKLIQSALGRR